MGNIKDMIDPIKAENSQPFPIEPVKSPEDIRMEEVKNQLAELFKIKPRLSPPSPKEFEELVYDYFDTIFPENYAKYTFHTFIGMSEANVMKHILPIEELKEIYEFVLEKFKAKGEIMLQTNGRATDSFNMQNIAGWRKKDPEESERESGLANLHQSVRDYKEKQKLTKK